MRCMVVSVDNVSKDTFRHKSTRSSVWLQARDSLRRLIGSVQLRWHFCLFCEFSQIGRHLNKPKYGQSIDIGKKYFPFLLLFLRWCWCSVNLSAHRGHILTYTTWTTPHITSVSSTYPNDNEQGAQSFCTSPSFSVLTPHQTEHAYIASQQQYCIEIIDIVYRPVPDGFIFFVSNAIIAIIIIMIV